MTRIAVLTAVELETRTLARLLGLAPLAAAWPRFGGGALELICVGPRASFVDARVAGAPALVVSAGLCGALSPDLLEGDLVAPEVVVGPGGDRRATAEVGGLARAGALLSVTEVVTTRAAKARLWLESRALACDMESGPILAWAAAGGIPAVVVRGVGDTAERGVPADLAAVVEPDGRVRTARAVRAVLARPRAFADALALRSGADAALKTVARTLATLARARV